MIKENENWKKVKEQLIKNIEQENSLSLGTYYTAMIHSDINL